MIIGHDRLIVAVDPDPKEAVSTEAGAMNYMNDEIGFAGKSGDDSKSNRGYLNAISNPNKQIRTESDGLRCCAIVSYGPTQDGYRLPAELAFFSSHETHHPISDRARINERSLGAQQSCATLSATVRVAIKTLRAINWKH